MLTAKRKQKILCRCRLTLENFFFHQYGLKYHSEWKMLLVQKPHKKAHIMVGICVKGEAAALHILNIDEDHLICGHNKETRQDISQ